MKLHIVTLFPEMVRTIAEAGVFGRAVTAGTLGFAVSNPRDFSTDPNRRVDDRPYGGGPGMVMQVAPLAAAIDAAQEAMPAGSETVLLTPHGQRFDQALAGELATRPGLVLVAGRYEGVDERIAAHVDREVSLGDYVLSGGEIVAMAVADAVARLVPGVLGDEASAEQESFVDGLLDCPHYTRPEVIDGRAVPQVLLGGDHAAIRRWRLKQALGRTWERRPDLIENRALTETEADLLAEYRSELNERQNCE